MEDLANSRRNSQPVRGAIIAAGLAHDTTVLALFTAAPGAELEIGADGTVLPIGSGDTTYTSFDGISFVAGQ